jgi:hypothetical protein
MSKKRSLGLRFFSAFTPYMSFMEAILQLKEIDND